MAVIEVLNLMAAYYSSLIIYLNEFKAHKETGV